MGDTLICYKLFFTVGLLCGENFLVYMFTFLRGTSYLSLTPAVESC